MKFLEIVRFELDFRFRRVTTWLFLALFAALSLMVTTGMLVEEASRAGDLHANAPLGLSMANIIISMMGLVVTSTLFSGAALRDLETRMHPLFGTSPITKTDYVLGRFTGALLVNVLLITAVPLGLMTFMAPELVDPALLGPFRPASYLLPYAIVLLPNVFFTGAILFAVAMLTRRSLPVFAVAAFLFVGALLIEELLSDRFGYSYLAGFLEPFGFSAISDVWEFWTPYERNTRLLAFDGVLRWNRVIWCAAGALILALTTLRYRGGAQTATGRRRRTIETAEPERAAVRMARPAISGSFDAGTNVRQMLAIAGESFRELVISRDFALMSAGLMAVAVLLGLNISDNFGTPFWPLTQFIAPSLGGFFPAAVVAFLTALYAGELVHRERDAGLGDIADANPVSDWALFAGRFAALALMLVALHAVLMASGLLLQVIGGYFQFEIGRFVQIVFGLHLADQLLFAALAMLVHVAANNKYLGHVLAVLCYLFTIFASRFGLEHNLHVYGRDPGWVYSDISGFGPFLGPVFWFKLYWTGWAILLAVLSNLLWVRGRDRGLRRRVRLAALRFNRGTAMTAIVGALIVLGAGGFTYYNTNILNHYRTRDEGEAQRARYERLYGKYAEVAQPTVRGTKLHVEIYPERRVAEVRGTYALVNATADTIRAIHLFLDPEVENRAVGFDRQSRLVVADKELGHRTYELAKPLAPGESLQMTFDVRFRPRGFPNSDINTSVVRNGTYFDHTGGRNANHRRWLPLIGYQSSRELSQERARRQHGLVLRPLATTLDGVTDDQSSAGREAIDFEAVIGTAADQIGVAPGTLRRSWTENGRRYFHYASDRPVKNAFAIFSADYAVHSEMYKGVHLELFHHPAHTFNLQRMVRSARTSLDYYTSSFGPYPHKQLRIVEFPRYASFAYAYPGTISYAEAFGWLTRVDEKQTFDLPSAVIAHEVAHQWWGYQVMPSAAPGAGMLSEVLAQYSALMVVEKMYGREMVERVLWTTRIEYLNRRGRAEHPDVPLLLVTSHANLVYRKGPLAMYALRQYIGEEVINTALRRFVQKYGSGRPPYPTSRDLYRELQAATPPEYHYLLADFLEKNTLWNLRTTGASAVPAGDGTWRVTLDVHAQKVTADGSGRETEVPMNDFVEIGVYAAGATANEVGAALYLEKQRIRSGAQRLTITVRGAPAKAGIDPNLNLIDRTWVDNIRAVSVAR